MIIIQSRDFIVAILSDVQEATRCLADIAGYLDSAEAGGRYVTIEKRDLQYPIYVLETFSRTQHHFLTYQTETKALEVANLAGGDSFTIYTVTGDYLPPTPWNDNMGTLSHRHLLSENADS